VVRGANLGVSTTPPKWWKFRRVSAPIPILFSNNWQHKSSIRRGLSLRTIQYCPHMVNFPGRLWAFNFKIIIWCKSLLPLGGTLSLSLSLSLSPTSLLRTALFKVFGCFNFFSWALDRTDRTRELQVAVLKLKNCLWVWKNLNWTDQSSRWTYRQSSGEKFQTMYKVMPLMK
jgi:hypothetical protein